MSDQLRAAIGEAIDALNEAAVRYDLEDWKEGAEKFSAAADKLQAELDADLRERQAEAVRKYPAGIFQECIEKPCPFTFKDGWCDYKGEIPDCDKTYSGPNGCKAHNNEVRFGGFVGLK